MEEFYQSFIELCNSIADYESRVSEMEQNFLLTCEISLL